MIIINNPVTNKIDYINDFISRSQNNDVRVKVHIDQCLLLLIVINNKKSHDLKLYL